MKKISENFNLEDFYVTNKPNIIFNPDNLIITNINNLVIKLLQPIRTFISRPIHIVSGYRPPMLNSLIGGSKTSDHLYGKAADITDKKISNKDLYRLIFEYLKENNIKFKQFIYEYDTNCVHISYDVNNNKCEYMYRYKDSKGGLIYKYIDKISKLN